MGTPGPPWLRPWMCKLLVNDRLPADVKDDFF